MSHMGFTEKHSTLNAKWPLSPYSVCLRNLDVKGKASVPWQLIWNTHLSLLRTDNWLYKYNCPTFCFLLKESQLIQMIILLECSEFLTSDKWQSRNDKPRLNMDKINHDFPAYYLITSGFNSTQRYSWEST